MKTETARNILSYSLYRDVIIVATIKDVAKLARTSPATVSRFLNGEKVKKENEINIMKAIDDLDYSIHIMARSLKTKKSYTVGCIVPDLTSSFFAHIAKGAQQNFYNAGYSFVVLSFDNYIEKQSELIKFLIDKNVDGVMIASVAGTTKAHLKELVNREIPLVLIDKMIPDLDADVVLGDSVNGTYNAIEVLIKNGHRKIAIINGPQDLLTGEERYKGYLRAFEDYGLDVDNALVKFGNYKTDAGYKKMIELLEQPNRPTAVFVANYYMAVGAIMAVNEKKVKIPDDLSFVSFDDMELLRAYSPPITAVEQPMAEIGEIASRILLDKMTSQVKDPSSFVIRRLKTRLILRDSIKNLNFL